MKKLLCWMLLACLLATVPACAEALDELPAVAESVDVAGEIPADELLDGEGAEVVGDADEGAEEAEANDLSTSSTLVQDFCEYADGALSFGTLGKDSKGVTYRSFSGKKSQMSLVKGYVNRLTAGGYNLVLNHTFNQEYGDTFWSVSLNYTGTANTGNRVEQVYDNNYSGDMVVYIATSGSGMKGYVYVASGLQFADLGLRSDGSIVSTQPAGASWNSALKVKKGKYCTADGRFKVKPGQAVVYRDGVKYTTKQVSMERDAKGGHDKFRIYNFYRNEGFALQLPYNSILTGDTFTRRQIGVGSDWAGSNMETFFAYTMNYILGVCHAGEFHMLQQVPGNGFKDAYLRVMRWDKKVAVLYICAEFDTAPYTVECMAVFKRSKAKSTPDGTSVSLKKGKSRKLTFGGREFDALSEVYNWEVVSGGKRVKLSGTKGQTCTVKGRAKGTARVRVTYNYSVYGRDVLTGNRNYEFKSKSQDFIVRVK